MEKNNQNGNSDSVTIGEIHNSLEIKSIRIHLNDGSCQGLFYFLKLDLKNMSINGDFILH